MSETYIGARIRGTIGWKGGNAAAGAVHVLSLAAAPTFAIMALLAAVPGGGPADTFCSATHHASPLGGMVAMYVLMSAFHSAPWLKLISSGVIPAKRSAEREPRGRVGA